jgi:MFS family permease
MALAYLLVTLANNVATAPWAAIIADRVPPAQRGVASGWNGLCTVLGTVVGALVAGLLVDKSRPLGEYRMQLLAVYGLIAALQLALVLATAWLVPETPLIARRPFGRADLLRTYWVTPATSPDFFWVCLTRFLMLQGIYSVFFFLQYYFEDVLGLPGERTVGAQFLPAVMLAALTTVYAAGHLSDRWGRKRLIYLSGGMMSLVCFAFLLVQRPLAVPICGVLFGIGYGAYTSVDWALACDVLPDSAEYGRDMGIWAVSGILPQVFGIVLGGAILTRCKSFPHHLGYTLLFCLALAWFSLGTLLLRQVRGAR